MFLADGGSEFEAAGNGYINPSPCVDSAGDLWGVLDAGKAVLDGGASALAGVGDDRRGGALALSADAGGAVPSGRRQPSGRLYSPLCGFAGLSESAVLGSCCVRGRGLRGQPGGVCVARVGLAAAAEIVESCRSERRVSHISQQKVEWTQS